MGYENDRKESFYMEFIFELQIFLEILKFWLGLSYSGWLRENKKAALFSMNIHFTSIYVPGEFLGILISLDDKKSKNLAIKRILINFQ